MILPNTGPDPSSAESGALPLSFGQRRLWFLQQLRPDNPAYIHVEAHRLRGPLDLPALQQAYDALLVRHKILRTTYAAAGETPVGIVHEPGPFPLARLDLRDVPAADRLAAC